MRFLNIMQVLLAYVLTQRPILETTADFASNNY